MDQTLPKISTVKSFLEDLLGKKVDVSKGNPLNPGPSAPVSIATYKDPEGAVVAACVVDLPLANYSGACLALLPPGVAKDNVRGRELPEFVFECLAEIYNIGARLFDDPDSPDVKLEQAYELQSALPEELKDAFRRPGARLDLNVDIQGYGAGQMSLLRARKAA